MGHLALRSTGPKRTAILEAAWACFLQYGYAKTSLGDVARRAGLCRPLIYHYFAGKERLFTAVIFARMEENFRYAHEILEGDLDRHAKLLQVLEVWLMQPLAEVAGAPQGGELFEQALTLTPEIHERHHALTRELLSGLIADETEADVFRLALKGQLADHPAPETLRSRVAVLAARFVI